MIKDPYAAAMKKIEACEREIAKLKSWLDTYNELMAETANVVGMLDDPKMPISSEGNESANAPVGKSRRAQGKQILLNAIVEILTAEQPLPAKVIYERLCERNVEVGGEKPDQNLTNYLSREKDLFFTKRGEGWSLVQTAHSVAEEQQSADEQGRMPIKNENVNDLV